MDVSELPAGDFVRHPWERARFRFFHRVVRRAGALGHGRAVLDVGAGDGWFARELARHGGSGVEIVGWDRAYAHGVPTSAPGLRFTAERPPGRFDLVLLLDVIEHVEDDRRFVDELVRDTVAPGGAVLISVPAWPCLFSEHDRALGHLRRYRAGAARDLLGAAGLSIVRAGGFFHLGLAARWAARLLEPGRPGAPRHRVKPLQWRWGRGLGRVADLALACDGLVSLGSSAVGLDVPGLSWWALCRKSC